MNSSAHHESFDTGQCPLCGHPNDCQLCTVAAYKGPCWCAKVEIPDDLIAKVPPDLRNQTCVCRDCVMKFHNTQTNQNADLPGDFYYENGLLVFTAERHLRRGYCCDSGCRHCPYVEPRPRQDSSRK